MKVAIPHYKNEIAPCFDVAANFIIYEVEQGVVITHRMLKVNVSRAVDIVRAVRDEGISLLICGGINNRYKYMLESAGIKVITRISGRTDGALKAFLTGELSGPDEAPIFQTMDANPPLADLINKSMEFFASFGFQLFSGGEYAPFPIDFVAEKACPICGKPIKVTVYCGMHMYRIDEEIKEFHLNAGDNFNVNVYIQNFSPAVKKACDEFGVQLIDWEQIKEKSKTKPQ